MRVNVDSAIFGDGRLKKLAKVLGVPWTQALGCLVAAWHHSYQARCAVVLAEDIDLMADVDGLAAAMVQSGLAAIVGKGKVRISGVTERIEWLEKQAERSTKGVEARRNRVNQAVDPAVNPTVNPAGQPSGQPNSPALLFSGSTSSLRESPPRADRTTVRVKQLTALEIHRAAAERLWTLQEQIRSESIPGSRPLKATDERLARVAARLDDGATDADCEHVLRGYAAGNDPGSWLNGETNWRRENFDRELGKAPRQNGKRQQTLEEAGIITVDEYHRRRPNGSQGNP